MADFENISQANARYNSAPPVLSDGEATELQVDANGKLLVQADVSVEVNAADGDSIIVSDGTDNLEVNADGSINITDNSGSLTVDNNGTFAVQAAQSGTWTVDSITNDVNVTQGTSPWVIGDGGGSLTVDAVDLDVRNLDAAQDNIAISDGSDTLAVNADGSINVAVTSGDTEADVSSDPTGDGLIPLTAGPDVLVSKAVGAGTNLRIYGWSWGADRTCAFRLEVYDDITLVEILRVSLNSGSMPSQDMSFSKPIEIAGATDRVVRIAATKVSGQLANGFGSAALNCATF